MKVSAEKIKKCAEWVEKNGIAESKHMPGIVGGAPINEFCTAMGIKYMTFKRWSTDDNFVNAITQALDVFKNTVRKEKIRKVEDALYEAATGRSVKTIKDGRPIYFPPNVDAIKFFLTNMDQDHWKNKIDNTTDLNVDMDAAPVIMFSDNPKPEGAAGEFTETRTEP